MESNSAEWVKDEDLLNNLKEQHEDLVKLVNGDDTLKGSRMEKKINIMKQDNNSLKRNLIELTQSKEILAEKVMSLKSVKDSIKKEKIEINMQIATVQAEIQDCEADTAQLEAQLNHKLLTIHESLSNKQVIIQSCQVISSEIQSRINRKENSSSKSTQPKYTHNQNLLSVRKNLQHKLIENYKLKTV